ncbi:hypothetical protein ACFSTA_17100 [Ornithinibacillus salinisoli]|uniref:Uncharacterized protein n=1 Tax=Ornithinibacillus salinisoli TaxID=1848459 RepID=A0ABW4W225_9BACI
MYQSYTVRHIFMAISISILFIGPILLLLIPSFVANSVHNTTGSWLVIVPGVSYLIYGIGLVLLFLAALFPFLLNISKSSILISIVCVILSGVTFTLAAKPFTSLATDSISFQTHIHTEKHTYGWDEIESTVYNQIPIEEGYSDYVFYFSDGNQIKITENGLILPLKNQIYKRLEMEGIKVE